MCIFSPLNWISFSSECKHLLHFFFDSTHSVGISSLLGVCISSLSGVSISSLVGVCFFTLISVCTFLFWLMCAFLLWLESAFPLWLVCEILLWLVHAFLLWLVGIVVSLTAANNFPLDHFSAAVEISVEILPFTYTEEVHLWRCFAQIQICGLCFPHTNTEKYPNLGYTNFSSYLRYKKKGIYFKRGVGDYVHLYSFCTLTN